MRSLLHLGVLTGCSLLAACAHPPGTGVPPEPKSIMQDRCSPAATSLDSRAGREWMREHGWRYRDPNTAERAYRTMVEASSPWPDWFTPQDTILPVGTRMQMALAPDQPADRPGGYATFERVATARDARNNLAIRRAWKPALGRVVTYEVITPMPVRIGPTAPQIDPADCRLLIGRWSQIEFHVPAAQRMDYLIVIDDAPIR